MQKVLISILLCLSFNAYSAVQVEVLSSEIGFEDYTQRKTLCLTIIRIPKNGSVLGILESIEDCYIGRKAKTAQKIKLNLNRLQKITDHEMKNYLEGLNGQLEFYFSSVE